MNKIKSKELVAQALEWTHSNPMMCIQKLIENDQQYLKKCRDEIAALNSKKSAYDDEIDASIDEKELEKVLAKVTRN